jgi:Kef-type K+ transport system membrane component KefB
MGRPPALTPQQQAEARKRRAEGATLPEGSEFSFVLFAAAVAVGALDQTLAKMATLVVALSMMAAPVLFTTSERFLMPRIA